MAIINAYQTAESGKFKQFPLDDTNYPAVSVTRVGYYDSSAAFPANTGTPTYSAVDIYPKYAVLTHLTNASDIGVSLSAGDINVNLEDVEELIVTTTDLLSAQLGQKGFIFIEPGNGVVTGRAMSTIQVVSACKIASINATASTPGNIINYELPVNFSFSGPITSISLSYGAVIAYYA